MQLNDYLAINVFHFFLIFARLSVVFMLMPGVSAGYIPVRLRLMLAVMITILVLPIVQDTLPLQPDTPAEMVKLFVIEVIIGGFIGGLIQIIMAALDVAGHMMSMAIGLMNAFIDDPVQDEQSAILIGFLNLVAFASCNAFVLRRHAFDDCGAAGANISYGYTPSCPAGGL